MWYLKTAVNVTSAAVHCDRTEVSNTKLCKFQLYKVWLKLLTTNVEHWTWTKERCTCITIYHVKVWPAIKVCKVFTKKAIQQWEVLIQFLPANVLISASSFSSFETNSKTSAVDTIEDSFRHAHFCKSMVSWESKVLHESTSEVWDADVLSELDSQI